MAQLITLLVLVIVVLIVGLFAQARDARLDKAYLRDEIRLLNDHITSQQREITALKQWENDIWEAVDADAVPYHLHLSGTLN